jgi:hypothetical protein
MLFGNERLYRECCELKRGKKNLCPLLERLRIRLSEVLGVTVLNFDYEPSKTEAKPAKASLSVIVESRDDYQKIIDPHPPHIHLQDAVAQIVQREFAETVIAMELQTHFDQEPVTVWADCFADEAMNQAASLLFFNDREALIAQFSADLIWNIINQQGEIVVFFVNEAVKKDALARGLGYQIRQACFDRIQHYDEFHYFTPENFLVIYESKENLDRNYRGNLFNYWKQ